MMTGNSSSAAAMADDASLAIRRTLIPDELKGELRDASSPEGDSYASPIRHADSLGACELMESQRASRSAGNRRPDDPGQEWRLSPRAADATEDQPVAMSITESAFRDSSWPQSKLQRRPINYQRPRNAWHTSHTPSPCETRYLGSSLVPKHARRPSQPCLEEHKSFHLHSCYGSSAIHAFSNSEGARKDVVALAPSVAALYLAAIITQASCRPRSYDSEVGYVAASSTPTAQATDIAIGVARGGPVRLWKGACAITRLKGLPYNTPSLSSGSGSRELWPDWFVFVSLPRLYSHPVQSRGMPQAEMDDCWNWNLNQEVWA